MTFSSLISGTIPHHNKFSSRNGSPVTRLIQHHWAGTGGGIERMSDPNQQASCTYVVLSDGQILGHVPEEYRPWTSGSAEADTPSVTIEVQNTGGQVNGNDSDPSSWPISEAAYGAIIRLLVDVAQRHGWDAIDSNTYLGHRQFYQTACPGGFLWARMDQTRQLANQLLIGGIAAQGSINLASTGTTEEGFLMALSDQDQKNIYEAISRIDAFVKSNPVSDIVQNVLFGNRIDGRNIVDTGRQGLANDAAILAAIGSIKPGSISAEDLAAAIPTDLAKQVADLLAERLAS